MSASYHDELTALIDDFLAEPVPAEATDEDREMLAELAAAANDSRRTTTVRPGAPRKDAR